MNSPIRPPFWFPAVRVGLLLAPLFCATPSSRATTWISPIRPLSDEERMEHAASYAHAVTVGTVVAVRDSLDDEGTLWRWMEFEPRRSLKGNLGAEHLRVYFPSISNFGWRQAFQWVKASPAKSLIFARLVRTPASTYWVLAEHPDFPGAGIVRLEGGGADAAERAVASAVARSTPEAVARRSALVVIGEVRSCPERLRLRAGTIKCTEVEVDSVIAGAAPVQAVRVYGRYGALGETGTMLLMLVPGEDGAYEVVGFSSGALLVRDGKIADLDESVPSFVARIKESIRTGAAAPTKP